MAKDRQNGSFERLQEEEDRTLPEPQTSTTGNTQGIELQPSSQQQAGFGATANSDYQHVSNVLGEAFYKAQRRRDRWRQLLADKPHPICSWPVIGSLGLCILLAVALALSLRRPISVAALGGDDSGDLQSSPEGRIYGDVSLNTDFRGRPREAAGLRGAVAADHGRCSDLGLQILQQGGNAVDAGIATALCQGVYNPQASGIGGGGFIMVRSANGSVEVIDAREPAPAASSQEMFTGMPAEASIDGALAIAVPLECQGLWLAHQRYGQLPWQALVAPAADLARSGFPAHPYLASALSTGQSTFVAFEGLRDTFYINTRGTWRAPRVNETCCRRPKLGAFLDEIAARGPFAVFQQHAQVMAAEIAAAGGIVSAVDIASAAPVIRAPLTAQVWGTQLWMAPPPSSGACIATTLLQLAGYPATAGLVSQGLQAHRLVEALKHAFALRAQLGDPGNCTSGSGPACFLQLTELLDSMLSPSFADSLRNLTSDQRVQPLDVYGGPFHLRNSSTPPDDHGTTHLAVVDSQGAAFAMTTTVNTGFGSKVISPSTGVLYNNQMDDFSRPDGANVFRLQPSAANYIRPGKRPLSSMSPMLLTTPDGRLQAVVGASGGPRIISAVVTTILRLLQQQLPALLSVALPRLHHQLLPAEANYEDWATQGIGFQVQAGTVQTLEQRGQEVAPTNWGAVSQVIVIDLDTGIISGASDPRKDGAAAAY